MAWQLISGIHLISPELVDNIDSIFNYAAEKQDNLDSLIEDRIKNNKVNLKRKGMTEKKEDKWERKPGHYGGWRRQKCPHECQQMQE